MKRKLSSREVLAVLCAIIGIPLILGSRPVLDWRAGQKAHVRDVRLEVMRASTAVVAHGAMLDSLEARIDRLASVGDIVSPGRGSEASAAALGAHVSGLAARAGLSTNSIRSEIGPSGQGMFSVVVVRYEGTGGNRELAILLADLESGFPRIAFRNFHASLVEPGGFESGDSRLRVSMVLEGIALTDSGVGGGR